MTSATLIVTSLKSLNEFTAQSQRADGNESGKKNVTIVSGIKCSGGKTNIKRSF